MILQCSCGKKWSLKDNIAKPGTKVTCRACKNPISVPKGDSPDLEAALLRIQELEEANESLRAELSRAVEDRIEEVRRLQKESGLKEGKGSMVEVEAHFLRDLNGFLASWGASICHLQGQIQTSFCEGNPEEEVLIEEGDSDEEIALENDLEETVSDPVKPEPSRKTRKKR